MRWRAPWLSVTGTRCEPPESHRVRDVARHVAKVAEQKGSRQEGDGRGSAPARRVRTDTLLHDFGGTHDPCVRCGRAVTQYGWAHA